MGGPKNEEKDAGERIKVSCPKCGEEVTLSRAEAERAMKARCSKGHEIPLVATL